MLPYFGGHSLSSKSVGSWDDHQLIRPLFPEREQRLLEYFDLYSFYMKQAGTKEFRYPRRASSHHWKKTVLKGEDGQSTRYLWDVSKVWCPLKLDTWHARGTTCFRKLQLSWQKAEDKSPHNLLRAILIALERQKIPEGTTIYMTGMTGKVSVCQTFILRNGWIYKYHSLLLTKKKGDNLLN